jgi:hypothetical protein
MQKLILTIILTYTFIFPFTPGKAQGLDPNQGATNLKALSTGNSMVQTFDNRYRGVKGGITLLENFVPGKIRMTMGKWVNHDQVNYDAYNDELLVLRDGKEMVVTMQMVNHFVLDTQTDTLHFQRLPGSDGKAGFFQKVTNTEKVVLYKKISKTLLEPNFKGAYSAGRDYAEFVQAAKYFVWQKGNPPREFKNKKSFLKYFPDNKPLAQFIKTEKIDFKNEADLKRIFNYLEESLN